jgi:Protein of unknown function DUF262/Protein of unknown function (DUF1524)
LAGPDFEPYRRTIEDLLTGSDYYQIPRFQRPYSWDSGNIDDFWRDCLEDNDAGYFIGPMVGWRSNPRSALLYIVDGQQRLTTITLLLVATRNALSARGQTALANGVHRYVEKPNRDNEPTFVLQPEVASPYLNNAVLSREPNATAPPTNSDEIAVAAAFRGLTARVTNALAGQSGPRQTAFLRSLRDKMLGLRVIWIEHGNEDDAYVVFETLNSRGKDLEVVDLLKNHLLGKLRRGNNPAADAPREQWNRVRSTIQDSQANIDINRFIQHWWLSQEAYVAQRKLFGDIKKTVRTRADASERLQQLEQDAPWYRAIYEPHSRPWGPEESEIPRALQALSDFGVTQPAPLLLALLRARRDGTASLGAIIQTLQTIERFHFQFTAIAQQSSSGGVSEMYAKHARELSSAGSRQIAATRLRLARTALVDRIPDEATFKSAFVERLVLTDELSRDKKLVQYVLKRLTEHVRPNTRLDDGTVEHLIPQSQIGVVPANVVGNIGNLLWVSERLNARLDNRTMQQKRRILQGYRSLYDLDDILATAQWGPDEITERAERLATVARQNVWRLPV